MVSLLATLSFATAAIAQTVMLPLQGYYRGGRYLPIEIDGASGGELRITATGAVPLDVTAGAPHLIVPLLTTGDKLGGMTIADTGAAAVAFAAAAIGRPHPLDLRECLVGVIGDAGSDAGAHAGGGHALARALFPGAKVITVMLDPDDPLPGPAIAWQSLDAIVMTQRWPGRLHLDELGDWLAGGMVVAVRSEQPPDSRLPWRPVVGGWVLRPNIAGPLGCDGNDDAYAPSATWHPDLPPTLRASIVGGGMIFALLVGAASLLPARSRLPAVLGISAATLAVVALLRQSQPAVYRASGDINVNRIGWEQRDRWSYFASPGGATTSVAPSGEGGDMWPIFLDSMQAKRLQMTLSDDGVRQRFTFTLPPDNRIAFLRREVRPAMISATTRGATPATGNMPEHASPTSEVTGAASPMGRLAAALYRDAGEPQLLNPNAATPTPAPDATDPTWPPVKCVR